MSANRQALRVACARVTQAVRRDRLATRLARLYLGLAGFGVSLALMVRARLGLDPWDVLQMGIATRLGVPLGWVVIGVGSLVMLAWISLRQRPGVGTVSNAIVVGPAVNGALDMLPRARAGAARRADDGYRRPRAVTARSAHAARAVGAGRRRCSGGPVGIDTGAYAVCIGPLTHVLLPRLTATAPTRQEGSNRDD
jgi:uncharacterized membrane protein YczE